MASKVVKVKAEEANTIEVKEGAEKPEKKFKKRVPPQV